VHKCKECEETFLSWKGFLFRLGNYNGSLECVDRAIQIDPDYAEAWTNKSVVLEKLGRHKEANQCFKADQLGYFG
jgi:tetratricopeptide (TPR) repeat protein